MNAVTLWAKNGILCIESFNEESKEVKLLKIKADIIDYEGLVKHKSPEKINQW